MLWIFLLDCVLRAPLRVKDLPLTLPLDGFFPAVDPIGGNDRLGDTRYRVLSVLLPSRRAQPCQYEDVRREQEDPVQPEVSTASPRVV